MLLQPFPMYKDYLDVSFHEGPVSRQQAWHELRVSLRNGCCSADTEGRVRRTHFSTLKLFQSVGIGMEELWALSYSGLSYSCEFRVLIYFYFSFKGLMTFPTLDCMESGKKYLFSLCLLLSRHLFIAVLEIGTLDSSPVFLGSGESSFVQGCPALCALRKQLWGS